MPTPTTPQTITRRAAKAATLREKAEKIARETVDPDTIPPHWPADAVLAIKGAARRAALAALTDKENAR